MTEEASDVIARSRSDEAISNSSPGHFSRDVQGVLAHEMKNHAGYAEEKNP
jgi:hypothetical protein